MKKAVLFAVLLVSQAAGAQQRLGTTGQPLPRTIYLSKDAQAEGPEVFVSGGIVTTLRFATPCDPSRTKLLGWEGRFEPLLVGGKSVVLVPLQGIPAGERAMLLVTLADGTALPFTVTVDKTMVDWQVDVLPNPETPDAVRRAFEETSAENKVLRADNRRQRDEGTSVDHALAALLANNEVSMTPLKEQDKWLLKEEGLEVEISILVPRKQVAKSKAAVVFTVTNKDRVKPWKLQEARLSTLTSGEPKPFALRSFPESILPGSTGRIAVVTDLTAFDANPESDKLVLEIFRDGGRRQGYVVLAPQGLR